MFEKKINYSLDTCCGVVLCCVAVGNEAEIKAKEAGISFSSLFYIPLVDHYTIHTYIYIYRIPKQQIASVLRPFLFLPVLVFILGRKNMNTSVFIIKSCNNNLI